QRELAGLSTLSIRAIRDLEHGRVRRPRKDTVRLLADALGLEGRRRTAFTAAAVGPIATDGGLPSGDLALNGVPRLTPPLEAEELRSLTNLLAAEYQLPDRHADAADTDGEGLGGLVVAVARQLSSTSDWSILWVARTAA